MLVKSELFPLAQLYEIEFLQLEDGLNEFPLKPSVFRRASRVYFSVRGYVRILRVLINSRECPNTTRQDSQYSRIPVCWDCLTRVGEDDVDLRRRATF